MFPSAGFTTDYSTIPSSYQNPYSPTPPPPPVFPTTSAVPTQAFSAPPPLGGQQRKPPVLPAVAGMGFGAAELGLNALDKGLVPALRESLPGQALEYVGLLDSPASVAPAMSGPVINRSPLGGVRALTQIPLPPSSGGAFAAGAAGPPPVPMQHAGVPPAGPSTLGQAANILGGAGAGLTTEGVMGLLGRKTNLGSQVGAAIGGAALAPFVPVIGGYLGGFIGGRVGSMFGPGVSVGPNGNASLGLNNGQLSVVDIGTDNNQPSEPIQQFSQAMVDGINKMSADGLVQFNSVIGSPAVFQKNTGLRVFDGSDDGKWVRAETGADLMSEMLFYNLVTGNAEVTNPEQFRETVNLMEGSATNRINTILDQQAEGTFEPASMKDIRKADQIGKGVEQTTEGPQRSGIGRATKAAIRRFPGAGSYITQQGLLQDWNRARGLPLNAPMRQPTEAELKTSPAQRLTAEKLLGARLRSGLGGRGRTRGI